MFLLPKTSKRETQIEMRTRKENKDSTSKQCCHASKYDQNHLLDKFSGIFKPSKQSGNDPQEKRQRLALGSGTRFGHSVLASLLTYLFICEFSKNGKPSFKSTLKSPKTKTFPSRSTKTCCQASEFRAGGVRGAIG